MAKYVEIFLSILKYLISGITITNGIYVATVPVSLTPPALGIVYNSRPFMVLLGIILVVSGGILIYGKLRRNKHWVGRGLMALTLCYLFGTILQAVAFALDPSYWVGNCIVAIIMAALYLRWKYQYYYVNPRHFVDR